MTADSDKAMANTYDEWRAEVDSRKRERNAAALLQERKPSVEEKGREFPPMRHPYNE